IQIRARLVSFVSGPKKKSKSCIDSAGNSTINLITSICVAGHSATLVRARSMLRTGHSVPDLTTSMARTVTQTKSFTDSAGNSAINLIYKYYEAGHSATLVRARPVLRAGHSAPDFS
ncbi:11480_t:CDS:1, partial [Funneliformis caledonium]